MGKSGNSILPKFDDPPVIETVLGVEFAPLEKWNVPHFGVFWSEIQDEFPEFDVKPPLASHIEEFDPVSSSSETSLPLVRYPEVRCWFIDKNERTLIQVQHNRFTYNWRKGKDEDPYPHYDDSIRPAFEQAWSRFSGFVKRKGLGGLSILQCEVTYINHLEVGTGWNSAADLNEVFPCWTRDSSDDFLPSPEDVRINVTYRIPKKRGRLRVSVQPAIRNRDGVEILQLSLTARGRPESSDFSSALQWLDLGREWVVRGFADFTSEAMHKLWKRRE